MALFPMNLRSGTPFDVAVIGAGASGTLVAAQFDRLAPAQARMILIGSQPRPARGLAYDTLVSSHLLNVPAGNMSAFPRDMDHFTRWLAKHLPGSNGTTFAPRKLYGDYLQNILTKLRKSSTKVEYLNVEAIELTRREGLWAVHLENGNVIEACSVVLALGNLLPPSDPVNFGSVRAHYFRNPWSGDTTKSLPPHAPVLLIGTGLTMADVVLSLREAGHRGPIHAISRHGRISQAHQPYQSRSLLSLPAAFNKPHTALRWIRQQAEIATYTGSDWRAVIDSLRPHTAVIWQRWSQAQRETFLRHARSLWDVHRHRMAPEVADRINALIEQKILTIQGGSLLSAIPDDGEVSVTWNDRETGETKTLEFARIINCTGPSRDLANVRSSFVSKLLATGWASPDPLHLGLETNDEGCLLDVYGNTSPGLFTLGPLRIANLWESIAIPEIRNQACELVELLIRESSVSKSRINESLHQIAY